jgi:hypothetical protein
MVCLWQICEIQNSSKHRSKELLSRYAEFQNCWDKWSFKMPFIDMESSFQQMMFPACPSSGPEPGFQIRGSVSLTLGTQYPRRKSGTCEWAEAVWLVDIPKLELRVGGSGHQVTAVQELDVAHSLPVALENVQSLLRRPNKIILRSITDRRKLIIHEFCEVFHEEASEQ